MQFFLRQGYRKKGGWGRKALPSGACKRSIKEGQRVLKKNSLINILLLDVDWGKTVSKF